MGCPRCFVNGHVIERQTGTITVVGTGASTEVWQRHCTNCGHTWQIQVSNSQWRYADNHAPYDEPVEVDYS